MLSWIETVFIVFVAVFLYVLVRQVDKLTETLERIEARLAFIKPLKSELDTLEEIEERAIHPKARIAEIAAELQGLQGPELHKKLKEIKWREKNR